MLIAALRRAAHPSQARTPCRSSLYFLGRMRSSSGLRRALASSSAFVIAAPSADLHLAGEPRRRPVQAFGLWRSWKKLSSSRSSWIGTPTYAFIVISGFTLTR